MSNELSTLFNQSAVPTAVRPQEFQILEMLVLSAGKCVNREKFIEKIWGYDTDAEYNTIEVYLTFIRRKLHSLGSLTVIKSVRGLGYVLE